MPSAGLRVSRSTSCWGIHDSQGEDLCRNGLPLFFCLSSSRQHCCHTVLNRFSIPAVCRHGFGQTPIVPIILTAKVKHAKFMACR